MCFFTLQHLVRTKHICFHTPFKRRTRPPDPAVKMLSGYLHPGAGGDVWGQMWEVVDVVGRSFPERQQLTCVCVMTLIQNS